MSDLAVGSGTPREGAFNPATMVLITAVGALAFIAMLVLGAYAPDLRSGHNGGSHALSKGATGFAALVSLEEKTGHEPVIVHSEYDLRSDDLALITPDHGSADLSRVLRARSGRTTLLVLPKWLTIADPQRTGWVRVAGLLPAADPAQTLSPANPLRIGRTRGHGEPLVNAASMAPSKMHFLAPAVVQTMSGTGLQPLITTQGGAIVLARLGAGKLYLLSEPDLLNNHGLGDERQARAALALIDHLGGGKTNRILFDVTANGLGHSESPLKLAFNPPFLAVTLTIFTALLLASWQALVRFGPIRRRERAIAFGKAALVDNSAALVRKARREARLGSRYATLIRERAMALFRLPASLEPAALACRLEALNKERSFAAAAEAASRAGNRAELLSAARALNQWLMEIQQ